MDECEKELRRMRYFMSVRIDYDSEHTVLEVYERINKDILDRMMDNEQW